MSYWTGYIIVLLAGFFIGAGGLLVIRRWISSPLLRKRVENLGVALLAFFLTLMATEIFFKLFFAQTENRNFTLASRNWFERHWALNSMGYRDIEWTQVNLKNKRRILISGDSFAAGHGIESIEDRFSNLLGRKLGNDYVVMNIAQPGFSTKEEIDRLRTFPYKPEILIHQYYINDIRYATEQRGLKFIPPNTDPWPILAPLVNNSYAINFIYWRTILLGPGNWQGDSMAWLEMVYNDPEVWWLHQQELLTIYEGALSEKVKLIVVIFPSLTNLERSRNITSKVIDFYEERGVPVLDVAKLIEGAPPDQLVVNKLDAHPSQWLHKQVANELYKLVIQLD